MIRLSWQLVSTGLALFVLFSATFRDSLSPAAPPPNIILILADDLGYGDLGCYGQRRIQTPALDRLAAQGIRFTQCYAGNTVCAPSRCALITGYHMGHARIRGNGTVPLAADDITLPKILKHAGYDTALFGKWGLGEAGTAGVPNRQGFDEFFGYLNQNHAHNYYPAFLWENQAKAALAGNQEGLRTSYTPDLFTARAIEFLRRHRERPFFLFLPYIIPHANNEFGRATGNGMQVPDDAPYRDQPWPQPQKNHAAMISRLDAAVGQIAETLTSLGLDSNTLLLFTSDNGPHKEAGADPEFFDSNGSLRGIKRDLYEGGIRVPLVAHWPGTISAGQTSDLPCAFWDLLPTLAELAGVAPPDGIDGLSLAPTLLGTAAGRAQTPHNYLYWEFHEGGFHQALRRENWKAVRHGAEGPIELYDLASDVGETHDIALHHPREVAELAALLREARTPSPHWPVAALDHPQNAAR